VVGARSAVFAPLPKLGLIVVDEEHDSAYKQDQAPRYHARSVAIKRAHMLGIPVLLGSATPSLESYHAATHRRQYRLLELPHRVSDFPLPPVDIVNLREEPAKRYQYTGSRSWHLLSLRLEKQLQKMLKEGGQAILLLNRRGYANYIACPDHRCGWTMQCEFCDAMMVYHVDRDLPTGGYVRCHYCGFENRLPSGCPVCQKKLTVFGLGTQRVEEEIERKFPNARLARIDSDTMRSAKHYAQTLGDFRAGRVDLLVGTQMIAKGLDFPNVRLVGVISADTSLALPDFRAAERTFQLVAQVAGRSGRSAEGGRVVVQTFAPDHPAIQLAAKHDYPAFAKRELAARERARMPPVTRIARIVVRDENAERCDRDAAELAARLGEYRDAMDLAVRVMGPMRPPRARVGGYHRREIQLIADNAATLQRLMTALRNAALLKSDAHTAVDVDPITLM